MLKNVFKFLIFINAKNLFCAQETTDVPKKSFVKRFYDLSKEVRFLIFVVLVFLIKNFFNNGFESIVLLILNYLLFKNDKFKNLTVIDLFIVTLSMKIAYDFVNLNLVDQKIFASNKPASARFASNESAYNRYGAN